MRARSAIVAVLLAPGLASAEEPEGDEARQVRLGMYVTALRFRLAEDAFDADFWVWAAMPAEAGTSNPLDTLEVVDAERIQVRYRASLDRTQLYGDHFPMGTPLRWHQRKISARFPRAWDLHNYPFDRHTLSIPLEESVEDISTVVYLPDTEESRLSEALHLEGWTFSNFRLVAGTGQYATTFGDPELPPGSGSTYTRVTAFVDLRRDSFVSFWKLTVGVYIAFLIAELSFFFDPGETSLTNPRTNMLVGGLFAVLVNMRFAESSLGPDSVTLVDRVHIVTLVFLFLAAVMTVVSRLVAESGDHSLARHLDRRIGFWVFTVSYLAVNVWMIVQAATEG